MPIYQTATFKGMGGAYDYSRSGNPSRTFLGARRWLLSILSWAIVLK